MNIRSDLRNVGNFDNNGGTGLLYKVVGELREEIDSYIIHLEHGGNILEGTDDHFIAALEMLSVMIHQYGFNPGVNDKTIHHWQEIYLPAFDKNYNSEKSGKSWEYRRRIVALDVFARLEEIVDSRSQDSER